MTQALMRLESVGKSYASAAGGEDLAVLRDVDLTLPAGASIGITGPSGSGKSTLLNIMGTLDRPTSGRVFLEDADLAATDGDGLARVRNRKIGFVFQAHHLLPQCTALENVLVPTLVESAPVKGREAEDRAKALLDRVGLGGRLNHRPGQLSGGERQRVAFVRALINRPVLVLADEPTGALDRVNAQNLMELLIELNREEGVALVVVTHAANLADMLETRYELTGGELAELERAS